MKLTKVFFAPVCIALFLSSCSLSIQSEVQTMSEIYSEALTHEDWSNSPSATGSCLNGNIVISSFTASYPFEEYRWETVRDNFIGLEVSTWESFLQVSSEQVPFPNDLDLKCDYILLDTEQHLPYLSLENCQTINYLSQIGFNARKNQALVFRTTSCGDYAYGTLYLIKLVDGHWVVKGMANVFVT